MAARQRDELEVELGDGRRLRLVATGLGVRASGRSAALGIARWAPRRVEVYGPGGTVERHPVPDWSVRLSIVQVLVIVIAVAAPPEEEPGMSAYGSVGRAVEAQMTALLGDVDASAVFSPPTVAGEHTVITACAVLRAGGFGWGGGGSGDDASSGGGGGGGGGYGDGRPVAVIDVHPGGVSVRPIVDVTRVGVTVLTAVVAVVTAWRRGR